MKNFLSIFISVSIWAVAIMLCLVFLWNCNRPQFFTVSMADESLTKEIAERKGIVEWDQLQVDSTGVVSLAADMDSASFITLKNRILREEMKAGRLMTAEQMSEKITGYYDKLIDVLIALFILFSIASYFVINNRFRKKYEEDKTTFVEEIKRSLLDSQSLHDDLVNGISTKIESSLVTEEDLQGLRNQIEKDVENFELLAAVYDDLTEKAASKEEVTDVDGNGNP
jgi:hypothetical protein